MRQIEGGINAAKGFQAAGVEAGVKYHNRRDMALVYSTAPCVAAGTFTTNVVKAAPVMWDMEVVDKSSFVQAAVVNTGMANSATGRQGMDCCRREAECAGRLLGIPADAVLIASTGVIGVQLPEDRIMKGIEKLAEAKSEGRDAARDAAMAIMTTDTHPKEIAVEMTIGGKTVTLGGMCKGSGMIHPNMCTMLGFLATDARISKEMLQKALREDIVDTFNMVSVDGDTSTNDTLIIMANGLAGNEEIRDEAEDYAVFCEALRFVNTYLARQMAGDGEGATALVEARVVGAGSKEEARILAKSVICSSLTKAAVFGHDANFGRILCALGYSGVKFDPEKVDLYFQAGQERIHIFGDGSAREYSEEDAARILSQPEVVILADMHMGTGEAVAWGCDLSYDYVKINADYRS